MTKITFTPEFKKELKRLYEKYSSLNEEMKELVEQLIKDPTLGTSLGNNIFKIRLGIKSKGKGKSGVARVISYLYTLDDKLYTFVYLR